MKEKKLTTEILVAGGGTSGVCAAIQAARMGAEVILVEDTPWLGGMLTAAGMSAIDGNHQLPSGLWGEFRQKLYDYYGGPEQVVTGWVSNTLFEPRVGNLIFKEMLRRENNITVFHGYWIITALKKENLVKGAIFKNSSDDLLIIEAQISIDATEYGDLMAFAGCEYNLGRESRLETGEEYAPDVPDGIIQDITYVAILKDYGPDTDNTIPEPAGYDPDQYEGTCKELCDDFDTDMVDCQTMLNYGQLPHNKYMINWPIHGNDFYLNIIEMSHEERLEELQSAKNFTLGWIYFVQTKLGLKNLGLANDEFPTADRLALIPYNRESRRLKGMVRLTTMDIENPYKLSGRALYKSGIAVGDYHLDHHHQKSPMPIEEAFTQIPAFNVPYGCLVPETIDNLLVVEKNISVTHLVNGCTRRQPVVMQIGQAAGASAALCIQQQKQPRDINIRQLQQVLLNENCWLMPFIDITPEDLAFQAVQRVELCGVLKADLISRDYANEMRIYPDKTISYIEAVEAISIAKGYNLSLAQHNHEKDVINRAEAIYLIWKAIDKPKPDSLSPYFSDLSNSHHAFRAVQYFEDNKWLDILKRDSLVLPEKKITRKEFAYLIDIVLNPFYKTR